MVIILKNNISNNQENNLRTLFRNKKIDVIPVLNRKNKMFVVTGRCGEMAMKEIESNKAVSSVIKVNRAYKLASKSFKNSRSVIKLNELNIGGKEIVIMAGPCSVETKLQINHISEGVKLAGCKVLRGGAFKPRTGPYDFQGLGEIGLKYLKEAARISSLKVVTEVMDVRDIEIIEKYTDIFQVGARNMQNYPLLKELGKLRKPVLLKRGMWATYKELLLASEYILLGGNENVILCERGIRTHVPETRFTLDLNAVAYLKHETHLPIFVDPSHGTGRANMVRAMSRAAIAAGADGLIIETHIDPRKSISDADQAISLQELTKLVNEVRLISLAVGRSL
ncbi:3-deoxy-7-phosphoheptulonate synthase [Candidatus Gottesmanbacteria bacterium CG11_big_fil_rev_8_21_14_0_20_37_11]|uniref:3-deoxy-7-phosphoheptulonate synthase n=3 Tax=Candidatus Gottesmaniibacteriota TaxID=1752720 RepID=A0A2M7RPS9_9BACT|nr:MAG: 3-deoxy-7-phosphoheptulonate synthase [Candidatus Gottesmanbacteria bacterium CG1_02_37_22]PIP32272.1 MAG: 3-deoxy-7-phosphoheptulonate synthase [Candidatus Gottesmanbacteria bacterium CG23_combo_of_CG06-09_8_20_14_all_37_19]PIR08840.1 MAG: 3-deoxy-7-phosphoheptulonate synthase [Candidatus Gottesmanbacteria bacterium CG11_big_fil_rev_8_21_14_0_20_37_11]PIZ02338.1 MAG: 3-deoxy-7-phosphoheptulonate synthase [Candidatus Gottesmanbacteria bacterium CG_4_10_14_0_8_um_filter_37_24]